VLIMPNVLVVPVELAGVARALFSATVVPAGLATTQVNPWRGEFEIVESPFLADANDYYMTVRAGTGYEAVEVGYEAGSAGPQLTSFTQPDIDGLTFSLRHSFGAKSVNWRTIARATASRASSSAASSSIRARRRRSTPTPPTSRTRLPMPRKTVSLSRGVSQSPLASSRLRHTPSSSEVLCPVASRMAVPKLDPQGVGSATTYLRRYSAAAMLYLTQADDDGEAARPQAAPAPIKRATAEQAAALAALAVNPEMKDRITKALAFYKAESFSALAEEHAATILKKLTS
jgi:hypothetical protein